MRMKKTKAPNKTLSPKATAQTENTKANKSEARSLFFGAAIDMTWQMAIAVLVPIIGGFELDKALHTSPLFIIIGFVLAMIGTFLVIKRALGAYNDRTIQASRDGK